MPFVRNSFTRMISKHRRSIRHQEVEEVDDEFDHILDLMMVNIGRMKNNVKDDVVQFLDMRYIIAVEENMI